MKSNDQSSGGLWTDPKKRSWFFQGLVLAAALGLFYILFSNAQENLARQNIASGFGFIDQEAGFAIGESPVEYSPEMSYSRALGVGLLNTLKIAVLGNLLAIFLGVFMGIARLSKNWLLAQFSRWYVEVVRNTPLLLQLFFWYSLLSEILPGVRQALNPLPGVYLSNRGLYFPFLAESPIRPFLILSLFVAIAGVVYLGRWAKKKKEQTGRDLKTWPWSLALLFGLPVCVWLLGGAPRALSWPELQGFNFSGGQNFSPEFTALLVGLVVYTGAFIAEIVRSGIQSVSKGQWEAASALGMRPGQILRLVILPQAMRVIIPPLTSQVLNLTKNSSLAVAIAYPDFVSVANTVMNQTGQAIELIAMIMLVYLTFSLLTSFFMNWYNSKVALVER